MHCHSDSSYKFSKGYGWVGIAHCAIFDDGKDNWFYASQGRLPKDVPGINASNAIMMGTYAASAGRKTVGLS